MCVLCHCKGADPNANKKPFRSGRKDFGIGSHLACADARYPTPPDLMRSGRDIRAITSKIKDDMSFIYGGARYDAIPFCDLPFLAAKMVSQLDSTSAFCPCDDGSDTLESAYRGGTARLSGLDIEIVHRRSPARDAEQISINLQAVPSFEANPFASGPRPCR